MRPGFDNLIDVLAPVRDIYVAALLETIAAELGAGADIDPEPVVRDENGRIRRSGVLDLPKRYDLRVGRGATSVMRTVENARWLSFEPIHGRVADITDVSIGPFSWNETSIRLQRAAGWPNWQPLRRWYLEWFQARFGEESPELLGVLHSLDGPVDESGVMRLTIDLGSASTGCFSAMLDALVHSGCTDISVGERTVAS